MKKCVAWLFLLVISGGLLWGTGEAEGEAEFGFVTNGVNEFWTLAQRGVEDAESDFGVTCEFLTPPNGTQAEQKRLIEALIAKGADGVAVTPINPDGMTGFLNEVAEEMILITHDSDAPESDRVVYIGTNNYSAGRTMGKLVKEVAPDGGEIMLFVGKLDVQNAIERRQGIIDELKGLPESDSYTVSPAGEVDCGDWTVLDTKADNVDLARAKQNAEDTLARYPDIAAMVGLWAYNGPMILSAVEDAGRVGEIPILAFDELDDTLQAIENGYIHATVVQDPYNFGYRSVELLTMLHNGDRSAVPDNQIIYIPERVIDQDNLEAFWSDINEKLGK